MMMPLFQISPHALRFTPYARPMFAPFFGVPDADHAWLQGQGGGLQDEISRIDRVRESALNMEDLSVDNG
jgi:hypothetical protein